MNDDLVIKIANSIEELAFGDNNVMEINIDGKNICIAKHNNHIMACAAKCPHAGGIMANGYVDAVGNIVCPLHRYKFNMLNGYNTSGEGYYLKTYNVETNETGVFIKIKKKKSFFDFFN